MPAKRKDRVTPDKKNKRVNPCTEGDDEVVTTEEVEGTLGKAMGLSYVAKRYCLTSLMRLTRLGLAITSG